MIRRNDAIENVRDPIAAKCTKELEKCPRARITGESEKQHILVVDGISSIVRVLQIVSKRNSATATCEG